MAGLAGNSAGGGGHRLVRPLAVLAVVAALCMIPLQIISYGFMPIDDALRHVAKAVSGRPWQDILVMRDGFAMDSHPGWHSLLAAIYHASGMSMDSLVVFSVVSLALFFLLVPVLFSVRAEAWAAAVAITFIMFDGAWNRMFFGRPFVITMTAVVVFCLLARKLTERRLPWPAMASIAAVVTLSVWLNCTWYLWGLPVVAMLLAQQWRGAARTAAAMIAGILLGACITGQPLVFLWLNLHHLFLTMGNTTVTRQLVSELQPLLGVPIVTIVTFFLLWRKVRGRQVETALRDPAFMMVVLCWFLGIFVGRFLLDWAMPAFCAWLVLEMRGPLVRYFPRQSLRRLALATVISLLIFSVFTRDMGGRWSNSLRTERLSPLDPDDPTKPSTYAQWLPEPGGIVYTDSMYLFYSTFYANPNAKWRYIIGFEPGWMPEEDLKIYRNIQWNNAAFPAFTPWVKKMRPEDRLILETGMGNQPKIPELEWHYSITNVWIGRLPRRPSTADTSAKPAENAPSPAVPPNSNPGADAPAPVR